MNSELKNGDLVHVSDISEDDTLTYLKLKFTFIGMDGEWFVVKNHSGRYESWPYAVKCNGVQK